VQHASNAVPATPFVFFIGKNQHNALGVCLRSIDRENERFASHPYQSAFLLIFAETISNIMDFVQYMKWKMERKTCDVVVRSTYNHQINTVLFSDRSLQEELNVIV
jgi:hypothetical protein